MNIETEHTQYIDDLAGRINRLGLAAPVTLMLEMHRPLRGLLHAGALVGQPMLAMCAGSVWADRVVSFFSSPENIEKFISALEKESK